MGLLSILLGSIAALYQSNIKRLLAYSAIAHMGYITLAISTFTIEGIVAAIVYLFIYFITSLGIFIFLINFRKRTTYLKIQNISDFDILWKDNPMMAVIVGIFLLSLAGIPPLAGFFGKLFVFIALIKVGSYLTVVVAILSTLIGAFYYL